MKFDMEVLFASLDLCEGNAQLDSPHKVMQSYDA